MNTHWISLASIIAAASLTAFACSARAQVFTEDPANDAGDTLPTADSTVSATSPAGVTLGTIFGSLNSTGTDADLFEIEIASPTTFSATTNNTVTNNSGGVGNALDTSLFLFDSAGHAIAANDDTNGATVTSTLPGGNALYASLTAGVYYIGISVSGNEPINSVNQLLFALDDDSTAVRGAAIGTNPSTESQFDSNNEFTESGEYEVDLTGVTAIPEPSTWALFGLGALALGGVALRRKLGQV